MLLDRIDIDAHGPLDCVELGPFSERLNVIYGSASSGKTAIIRFVRDSLIDRAYPLGMMNSSSGRVVWADRNGLVHCRREKDGTHDGRRSIEVENRSSVTYPDSILGTTGSTWVNQYNGSTSSHLATQSIQLPESIVDGVMTDTSITDVGRVVAACQRSGLESAETYQSLPLGDPLVDSNDVSGRNSHLHREIAEIESELLRIQRSTTQAGERLEGVDHADQPLWMDQQYQRLIERRRTLTDRLTANPVYRRTDPSAAVYRTRHDRAHRDLAELHSHCDRLRARRAELLRWIETIDHEISQYPAAVSNQDLVGQSSWEALRSDEHLRRQLDDLDGQMIHWRRALMEVRGLQQAVEQWHASAAPHPQSTIDPFSIHYAVDERSRYEHFLRSIDRYRDLNHWTESYARVAGDSSYQRILDLEGRLHAASRVVDRLATRYRSHDRHFDGWYDIGRTETSLYAGAELSEALRSLRNELNELIRDLPGSRLSDHDGAYRYHAYRNGYDRLDADRFYTVPSNRTWSLGHERWTELRNRERWLAEMLEAIGRHREELLRRYAADQKIQLTHSAYQTREDLHSLRREQESCRNQYDQLTHQLDTALRRAADVRLSMRSLPIVDSNVGDFVSRPYDTVAIEDELRQVDSQLADLSRWRWLRTRREQLLGQFESRQPTINTSPLSNLASQWLARLTDGRLQRVVWSKPFRSGTADPNVTIDGHVEASCSTFDRSIAAIAVRLAAGELLHRLGRPVPLIVEALQSGEVWRGEDWTIQSGAPLSHAFAATLRDYVAGGRQVIVLTSDQTLTHQLGRAGARSYQLRGQRTYHAHQPLWDQSYSPEQYVGPHPHTYGQRDAVDHRPLGATARTVSDINRDLDIASEHASGFYRDGYYYADTYTTRGTHEGNYAPPQDGEVFRHNEGSPSHFSVDHSSTRKSDRYHSGQPVGRAVTPAVITAATKTDSPFFLSVDSPIDQAPSIDAVAAARLRGLNVTHITHLMQQDPNRLADALGMADVQASTIRSWQSECRLVCRVPHLRGFDARVIVNCGITTPSELAKIHPVDLLQRVEAFLATDRGQQLLLSGSSHELSRLTGWIAAGNANQNEYQFDRDRYEYDTDNEVEGFARSNRSSIRSRRSSGSSSRSSRARDSSSSRRRSRTGDSSRGRYGIRSVDYDGHRPERRSTSSRRSQSSSDRLSSEREDRDGHRRSSRSQRSSRSESSRDSRREYENGSRSRNDGASESSNERELRFYLHRESPVVDAPSIGPSMAGRLAAVGIHTVDDLLTSDAETVAEQLDHRRVEAETVAQWQQQATLVCRVPMLRGHDAQLLVASEVTTAEELAAQDANVLWDRVEPVANSSEGKRIIRGGKLPDLEEIVEWIQYAQQNRALQAA